MRARAGWAWVVIAALPACRCGPTTPTPAPHPPLPAPTTAPTLRWKGQTVPVRVLTADPDRRFGFAGVAKLAPDDALLRVWPAPTWVGLANHDYQVATELAFCDATGKVVARDALGPDQRPTEHARRWAKAPAKVQYVLELPPGRLGELGIDVGAQLEIAPDAATGAGPPLPLLPDLPLSTVDVGGAALTVEIAHTTDARRVGLMLRDTLPEDRGMLFVYPRARQLSFWMKNCPVSIDVAYLAADGRIVSIYTMAPAWHTPDDGDVPGYPGAAATPLALEVAGGWFAAHGVQEGDRVTLPADINTWRQSADR